MKKFQVKYSTIMLGEKDQLQFLKRLVKMTDAQYAL
jgi:hypothetical protein